MKAPEMLHSTPRWGQHELRNCAMPYMVMIPVMDIQDWNAHSVYHQPSGQAWGEWCEHLARSICYVHRESQLCVGYFFVDIPGRDRHSTGGDNNSPSLSKLGDEERGEKVYAMAKGYYETICRKIREVEPNHLIFEDRYNGDRAISGDFLSVQSFCELSVSK